MTLTHLDVFSGIGGFALAASWAGYETVGFVEIDPFCQRVLAKNFPGVPIHDDIRTFDGGTLLGAHRKDYDQAVRLYEAGFSIEETADYYGITRQAMWAVLRRRGVEMRPRLRHGSDNHFYRGGPAADKRAYNLVETAIERGVLTPQPCEVCGANGEFADGRRAVQAHHDDYNRPLDVRWLCQPCHHEWHTTSTPIGKEVMPSESSRTIDLVTGGFP
jgi:hypothetical protein